MAQRLPTVEIETENGPVLINATDYDPDAHKLSLRSQTEQAANQGQPVEPVPAPVAPAEPVPAPVAPAEPVPAPAPAPSVAADASLMVTKKGKKHFVIGQDGQPVVAEGIDAAGYASDQAAWDAILQRGK